MNDTPKPTVADPFRKMAERMEHNADSPFGGAAVLVSPGGSAIEILVLDKTANEAQFWSTVVTRIQMVLAQLEEKQRTGFAR